MKGAIEYLREVRKICRSNKGDCKMCPLGCERFVDDCLCPRLSVPSTWTNDKIVDMIRIRGDAE